MGKRLVLLCLGLFVCVVLTDTLYAQGREDKGSMRANYIIVSVCHFVVAPGPDDDSTHQLVFFDVYVKNIGQAPGESNVSLAFSGGGVAASTLPKFLPPLAVGQTVQVSGYGVDKNGKVDRKTFGFYFRPNTTYTVTVPSSGKINEPNEKYNSFNFSTPATIFAPAAPSNDHKR